MQLRTRKATRVQTTAHNRGLVLSTIFDRGQISRADTARATGLTRTAVSAIVTNLMKRRLVEEVGYGPSTGGKPPVLLSVADDSHHLIGLDLASSEFRGAVVNLRGQIKHQESIPLRGRDGQAALDLVFGLVEDLKGRTNRPLLGIGIGTPGLMDPDKGVVRRAVNLDWEDLSLRSLLQKRYNLPVHVANDCQASALAEHTFGRGRDLENLAVVKVEHGIGAGIILNGQLFHGELFGAGEIGHMKVTEGGRRCRCGNLGCLETVASARAIVQQALKVALDDPRSLLHEVADDPKSGTIGEVCRAAEAGDAAVQEIVQEAGRYLGIALANLISVLSIRHVLIAGSVTCFGSQLLDVIRGEMLRHSLELVVRETEVEMSGMGPEIVILGASALVLTRELGLFATLPNGV